jgi:hypothetical protein
MLKYLLYKVTDKVIPPSFVTITIFIKTAVFFFVDSIDRHYRTSQSIVAKFDNVR